jgi:hypothetical protein
MLEPAQISNIAANVAKAKLSPNVVSQAVTESMTDSQGHDALRVTIVIRAGAAEKLKGDSVLDTLVEIQDRLREAGEERFAIVEYATQDELETGGDSQP